MSSTTTTVEQTATKRNTITLAPSKAERQPIRYSGSLDKYPSFHNTPAIGLEFRENFFDPSKTPQIRDILKDEAQTKDLAVLVAERGVVFFRGQDLNTEEQKHLVDSLGKATGKPNDSSLHIHPLTQVDSEFGDEVSIIASDYHFTDKVQHAKPPQWSDRGRASNGWHTDITFEPVPSDYAVLQIHEFPKTGGDTLWASAYEAYDRLSPYYQKFLQGLTATHIGQGFVESSKRLNLPLRENRGNPLNVGQELTTVHPVLRTNPVTGWTGLFVNSGFTKRINELSKEESDNLLQFLFSHITQNHDTQVRFRWEPKSVAIWDNRSTFHTATKDFSTGFRLGHRAVSIGEKPYLAEKPVSRRDDLSERQDIQW